MGRIMVHWRGMPGWAMPAAVAAAIMFASFATLAEPPKTEAPDRSRPVVTTAYRTPLDERGSVLADLGVVRWHQQGWRGQGVKVAILDSGFRGYQAALGNCLPKRVTAKSFRVDGDLEARDSQHGILCAEVIHALAPDAELLLANWEPDSPESFARALAWAKREGARVATCSVIMPSWSDGAGGGPVHAALRATLGDGQSTRDMTLTASAGNLAQRHWGGTLAPNRHQDHQWIAGQQLNPIVPWGNERVAVELYGSLSCACQLQVIDRTTGKIVQDSELTPENVDGKMWGQTAVRFEPEPRHDYAVSVRVLGVAAANDCVHLVVLGGHLDHCTQAGSIPFPGDGTNVMTFGCVDERRQRLAYSSCGPNSQRPKPDFVAQVPFPLRFRDRPFTGTSAAAPQGAALAAILMSRDPSLTPQRIHDALRGAAVDLSQPGHDGETGFGLLRLP